MFLGGRLGRGFALIVNFEILDVAFSCIWYSLGGLGVRCGVVWVVLVGRVDLSGGFSFFAWFSSWGRFVLFVRHFCWGDGGLLNAGI